MTTPAYSDQEELNWWKTHSAAMFSWLTTALERIYHEGPTADLSTIEDPDQPRLTSPEARAHALTIIERLGKFSDIPADE